MTTTNTKEQAVDRTQSGHDVMPCENRRPLEYQKKIRQQDAFLQQLAKWGTIKRAAEASHVHRQRHYEWLKTDPAYAKLFAQVLEETKNLFEDELYERALYGVPTVKTIAGRREELRKFDSKYLLTVVKAMFPEKYREHHDVVIANLGEITERLIAGRERANKAKAELGIK